MVQTKTSHLGKVYNVYYYLLASTCMWVFRTGGMNVNGELSVVFNQVVPLEGTRGGKLVDSQGRVNKMLKEAIA